MNTKNKAVYTMIGGLLIKNVPHYAKKIKILSNGSIIAVDKSGNESFIYSTSPAIHHDYDKYDFVVFPVPPLVPVFDVGRALGFDSFGVGIPPFNKSSGGIVDSGKNYVVGETPLTTEIPNASTESVDVTEIQHENKKSLNILNLYFYDGEKFSNILKMVESEIAKSGINVDFDCVENQKTGYIEINDSDNLLNVLHSKLAKASDKLSNQLFNRDCDEESINETMDEICELRKSIIILSSHKKFIIKPIID